MSTSERVKDHLRTCDLRRARVDSVARALGMSASTMCRRLREERTSYQVLLDEVRKQIALDKLETHPHVYGQALSDLCGYTQLNSFYRAFRRWVCMNLREWRRIMTEAHPSTGADNVANR